MIGIVLQFDRLYSFFSFFFDYKQNCKVIEPSISSVSENSLIVQLCKCAVSNTVRDVEKQKIVISWGACAFP